MRGCITGIKAICTVLVLYLVVFASCVTFPKDSVPSVVSAEVQAPIEPHVKEVVPEPVLFSDEVHSLFIHPLIVNAEKAFVFGDSRSFMDKWFVTVNEFRAVLAELYMRNYILIRPSDIFLYDEISNRAVRKELYLPSGKYPLLFSVDDVNYYETMRRNGTNRRLVVDESGRVATEEDEGGLRKVSLGGEFVGVLEDFITLNPDFSHNGARGVIALTGYYGIFGYETHKPTAAAYTKELAAAREVAQALKQSGWDFASHSYGHIDISTVDPAKLAADCALWKQTVEPIVGSTPIFIYPFGAEPKKYPENLQILQDSGYRFYFSVGQGVYNRWFPSYVLIRRRQLDGVFFRSADAVQSPFFDIKKVFSIPRR